MWPAADLRRTLVVSAAMFVLGLGAWRALDPRLPPGPFDLLHGLPGFEAIGIPARFWGYLALPMALFSAAALTRLEDETDRGRPRRLLWAAVFVSVLGFQAVSLALPFVTPKGRVVVTPKAVPERITEIRNVHGPRLSQAAELAPRVGLLEAYNLHDYIHGRIRTGSELVQSVRSVGESRVAVNSEWDGWSRIRLGFPSGAPAGTVIVLNQNFHPRWSSSEGIATRNRPGNLCVKLAKAVPDGAVLELDFHDRYSVLGSRVSFWSALAVLAIGIASGAAALARRLFRKRSRASGGASGWGETPVSLPSAPPLSRLEAPAPARPTEQAPGD
jgi:hypothetical protein